MEKSLLLKRTALLMLSMLVFFPDMFAMLAGPSDNEVTLVVNGEGTTKDEATKVALRSAIEQAFGTFVSSNTAILNDELVKDEIVTVSSGNIKKYEYIANTEVNGSYFVTLKAIVSVGKLISYTKNHGSVAELAGATFAMNIKMETLYAENEKKAMDNLIKQIEKMIPYAFDYSLSADEPVGSGNGATVSCRVSATATNMASDIYDYFWNTVRNLFGNNQSKGEFGGSMIEVERKAKSGYFKNDYLSGAK